VYRCVLRCCPRAFSAFYPNSTIVVAPEAPFDIAQDRVSDDWSSACDPRAPCRRIQRGARTCHGPQEQMEAITIGANDDTDLCRTAIIEAVNRVDGGDGVVILTDMFGGTPSNLAISGMNRPNVDVLAGMNLPMLVKLAKVRQDRPLREAIDLAQEAGRKYVTIASSVLAGK
jgi:mannose PTS system EIIA component